MRFHAYQVAAKYTTIHYSPRCHSQRMKRRVALCGLVSKKSFWLCPSNRAVQMVEITNISSVDRIGSGFELKEKAVEDSKVVCVARFPS